MTLPVLEQQERLQGTRRPLVPAEIDAAVGQYAEKNSTTKKEAYREIIKFVIDLQGDVRTENVQ